VTRILIVAYLVIWVSILAWLVGVVSDAVAAPPRCNRSGDWTPREVRCQILHTFPRATRAGAVRVARCESGLRRWARSGRYHGIYQIDPASHPDAPDPYNVPAITRWVEQITRGGRDWSSWSCRP
jgi:hypothetical protein